MQGFCAVFRAVLFVFLRVRFYYVASPNFGVDMSSNYIVIFINLLLARVRIIPNTTGLFVPGKDKISRVWHNFFFRILGHRCSLTFYFLYYFKLGVAGWFYVDEARVWCFIL